MATVFTDQITGSGETVAYKAPCRVATTATIPLSGLIAVDGVTVAANDRVLVKDQTDAKQNGIYIASTGPWPRSRDFDSNRDITKGTRVSITDGSTEAGYEYRITTDNPINVGNTNISFSRSDVLLAAEVVLAATEDARDDALAAVPNAFPFTLTALKALDTSTITSAYLKEAGREGQFAWNNGDLSSILLGSAIASSAVDSSTEKITSNGHGLLTGNAVVATSAVNGLSTNTLYYVIYVDANNFKLASSHANAVAGTAFDLTGTSAVTVKQHYDPEQGIYVYPTTDISGASGSWVRQVGRGGVEIEWFGGRTDPAQGPYAFDNKRYFDAAIIFLVYRNYGNLLFRSGIYTFLTAPNAIGAGISLIGNGHSSSFLNGGTVLMRNFNQGASDPFLMWDGHALQYNSTGGGVDRVSVLAGPSTTGGIGVMLYAISDNYRPGYMSFSHGVVFGTQGGTWNVAFVQDGSNCTTGSTQGLRDVVFTDFYLASATGETAQFNNATNNRYNGLYVFDGGGGQCLLRMSGASSASLSKTTLGGGHLIVLGTLVLDNCDKLVLFGYAADITVTVGATNCKFYGGTANAPYFAAGTTRYQSALTNHTHLFEDGAYASSATAGAGFRIHPDGIIEAWGEASIGTSATAVSFGVTFGAKPDVQLTVENASAASAFKTGVTTTGFSAAVTAGPVSVGWRAIGRGP